jgi:hypothetical protein
MKGRRRSKWEAPSTWFTEKFYNSRYLLQLVALNVIIVNAIIHFNVVKYSVIVIINGLAKSKHIK